MGQIMNIMQGIQAQGEAGRQRGLSQLVGQAYNAPADQRQAILGRVAAQGEPGMAYDAQKHFEGMDDTARTKLGQYAMAFDALPDEQKATAYPQLAAQAQALGIPAPSEWNPAFAPNIQKLAQTLGAQSGGHATGVQSTYIDDKGQRVAIMRDGSVQVLGANAPNNQIIDTGNGFFGVNRGNLQAAPVMTGGAQAPQQQQAPQPQGMQQVQYATSDGQPIPAEDQAAVQAAFAADARGQDFDISVPPGGQPQGLPPALDYQNGGQLRSAPKPTNPMDQARLQLAQQAAQRDEARLRLQQQAATTKTAPKPADEAKAQKIAAARADALDSVTQAISGIDTLTKSGGFQNLGTFKGDLLGMIPHTQTMDAGNALETVKNQVLLTTLGKLKALSATGASGFGALSNSEGNILKNSIANIETAQSHAAIVQNLNTIRQTLQRAAGLIGGAQPSQDAPPASGWSIQAVP